MSGNPVPLPDGWTEHAKSGALQAITLARFALTHVRSWCADSRLARVRLAAERDAAVAALAQQKEEVRILRTRLEALPSRKRPHYAPQERLAILMLRSAAGWTMAETARTFLINEDTIASWMKRKDEDGLDALLKMQSPVNRFPEYVGELVRRLRALQPSMGKVRIADMLARAGLHISATTVRRMLETAPVPAEPAPAPSDMASSAEAEAGEAKPKRRVTARYPHHVWNVDITLLPRTGWWVPWAPHALAQRAPFCAWLVVVLDHFSRSVVGYELFEKEPTANQVCDVLDRTGHAAKATPKYIISDLGPQFGEDYRAWCDQHGVRPRFGAVGEHGSIAVIERFFRSLKTEMVQKLPWVPMSNKKLADEVAAYRGWYELHRPHQALGGRTPHELATGSKPARDQRRFEPRPHFPLGQTAERPNARRVKHRLVLVVDHFEGRTHLPIVSLRDAA